MSGGVDGVSFTNINIRNSGPSVRIKSQCGRRAYVRNVLYVPTPGLRPANSIICTPKSFANIINVLYRLQVREYHGR
jgi:polygalacturonase